MRLTYHFFHKDHTSPIRTGPSAEKTMLQVHPNDSLVLLRHLLICVLLTVSFACLVAAAIITLAQMSKASLAARVADQVLRFHVIAHSDSPEDQALKLEVRDALIAYMAQHSSQFDNAAEAAAFANDHCLELQQIARDVIHASGYDYSVTAAVTICDFPDKTYGDLTFPAGKYQALRVEIGQAQGQNWWCILYPLLCFTEEGMVTVPTESQILLQQQLSSKDYHSLCAPSQWTNTTATTAIQYRLWFWDWLQSFFME